MHETLEYITLTEAAKLAPNRPSTNCLWRWCRKGVVSRGGQRVRMKHVRIGGMIYTTAAWLDAFGQQLAEADAAYFDLKADLPESLPHEPRLPNQRRRLAEIERAERELEAAGA
jgi:hypothetical protein